MSELDKVEILFSAPFLRRLKGLAKRYRHIQPDLQPFLAALELGDFQGDRIVGLNDVVLKERIRNSDIPTGKSGEYRVIYQILSERSVLLLLIYAKSDQADIALEEIREAIQRGVS
ncbi:MAG: type II toxin-antitoxin system RelE/ParE family toxin [Tildeniella nuda ZEHNDER 1965/U140]|jgi:mRNA-degrading endonuclease RelE of RelBE toxin-antitoxin system|nr:type II toxin-antitoxin system RelE/ParE family toxin [Tildeniella nuda ZEHNDER 1965/U140]